MKLLPCRPQRGPRCQDHAWFKTATGIEPALGGRHQSSYPCAKCRNTTFLTLLEFNRLPELAIDEVRDRAAAKPGVWGPILRMYRRDFEGMGLSSDQADQLLRVGFRGAVELRPRALSDAEIERIRELPNLLEELPLEEVQRLRTAGA